MSKIKANAIENVAGTSGYDVSASFSHRNKLINGGFDVNERPPLSGYTVPVTAVAAGYGIDRWTVQGSGSPVIDMFRNVSAADGGSRLRIVISSAPSVYLDVVQRIENVKQFSGKTFTVSFDVFATDVFNMDVYLGQKHSTAGAINYNSELNIGTTVASEWVTMTATIYCNTYAENGSPTYVEGEDYMQFMLRSKTTATGSIYFRNVQLEEGSVATPFEQRPIGLEEILCKRYYQELTINKMVTSRFSTTSSVSPIIEWEFETEMRAVPDITAPSLSNGVATIWSLGNKTTRTVFTTTSTALSYTTTKATADAEL